MRKLFLGVPKMSTQLPNVACKYFGYVHNQNVISMMTISRPTMSSMGSNPSLKRSANGMSRWPSSAGPTAHFALAVQRAMPLSPA